MQRLIYNSDITNSSRIAKHRQWLHVPNWDEACVILGSSFDTVTKCYEAITKIKIIIKARSSRSSYSATTRPLAIHRKVCVIRTHCSCTIRSHLLFSLLEAPSTIDNSHLSFINQFIQLTNDRTTTN